jgi:hypothetical protein
MIGMWCGGLEDSLCDTELFAELDELYAGAQALIRPSLRPVAWFVVVELCRLGESSGGICTLGH